jgi:hypothetical protein
MAGAVAYNWTGGTTHHLDVRVAPTTAGDFTFHMKSVASAYLSYLACFLLVYCNLLPSECSIALSQHEALRYHK